MNGCCFGGENITSKRSFVRTLMIGAVVLKRQLFFLRSFYKRSRDKSEVYEKMLTRHWSLQGMIVRERQNVRVGVASEAPQRRCFKPQTRHSGDAQP